jgi:hypothetical protein
MSVRTFVIPFYYGSGFGTETGNVVNYGSSSAKAKSCSSYGFPFRFRKTVKSEMFFIQLSCCHKTV